MSYSRWTDNDINILKGMKNKPTKEIEKKLQTRSIYAIQQKFLDLNIDRGKNWSEAELEIVRTMYPSKKRGKILKRLPNRTWKSICHQAYKIRVYRHEYFQVERKIQQIEIPKLSNVERAYTAGLFDGEGYACLTYEERNHRLTPQVGVTNTNLKALEYIQTILNFGYIYALGKACKAWRVTSFNGIIVFVDIVSPFLKIKEEDARLVTEFCKERLKTLDTSSPNYTIRDWEIFLRLRKRPLTDIIIKQLPATLKKEVFPPDV